MEIRDLLETTAVQQSRRGGRVKFVTFSQSLSDFQIGLISGI